MGFQDAVRSFIRRYADFQGRSSRSEYWWAYLAMIIVALPLALLMSSRGFLGTIGTLLYVLYALAIIVPSLAISFRRLHDIDKSAWWILIGLIPVLGALVLLVFAVLPGTKGANRFGPDPLGGEAEVFA